MAYQLPGVVPKAFDSRKSMSALTAAEPFNTRDNATRVTPNRFAASVTVISVSHSRSTSPGCGGLCMVAMMFALVIVLIVHKYRVAILEGEGQAPVAADPYSPMVGKPAVQRVQLPTGRGHVARGARCVQTCQLQAQARGVFGLYARSLASAEKGFDAFMPEGSDHAGSV